MKRVVRRGCFETNSSSMHSIVVTKNDSVIGKEDIGYSINSKGIMDIWSEDDLNFGRYPFKVLCELEDKVEYAISSYCTYMNKDVCKAFVEKLENIIKEELPDFKGISLPKEHVRVYKGYNGKSLSEDDVHWKCRNENDENVYTYIDSASGKELVAEETDQYENVEYYGYVDHQSLGLLENFIKKHNITLKEFLFNKKYVVIIDGDEYDELGKIYNSGLLDTNNIDEIYPRNDKYGRIPMDSVEAFNKLESLK